MESEVTISPYHSYFCLTSSRCRSIGLLAVKRELGTEAITSVLLSFIRAASGCKGLSLGPGVTWVIEHQAARRQDEQDLCSGPVLKRSTSALCPTLTVSGLHISTLDERLRHLTSYCQDPYSTHSAWQFCGIQWCHCKQKCSVKSNVERSVGEKNKSGRFPKIYFSLSSAWWRTEPTVVLIRTGKTVFAVPATLCPALPCSEQLLLEECMAHACWKLGLPGPGLDCECCCSSNRTCLSWHSLHYFRARSKGKNICSTVKRNTTFSLLPASWLIFFLSFYSFSCLCSYRRRGMVAISMVMLLPWQNVLQACAFLDWL